MPRTARASVGGMIYHATNRGNREAAVFHVPADYDAFVDAIGDASRHVKLDVLAYCLMPNHFHLVLKPHEDGDLGRWMQWLLTAHVRRYHRQYGTSGHVWQGRFKAFPIQEDEHLATVVRYVEHNPVRAELVARAEHWKWSSLPVWLAGDPGFSGVRAMARGPKWLERVNDALSTSDLEGLRTSVVRGRPFGSEDWTLKTAERLGLGTTMRLRGRPKKK